jgi:trimethylamine--corrinoid protein Co-methyltransferase
LFAIFFFSDPWEITNKGKCPMQPFEILTQKQIEQIHQTAMQILEQIGVEFGYPPALDVLKKGGAKVDGERVFFTPRLIEEQIKKAPRKFTLYARNPENNVVIGGNNMAFCPGYGAPFVTDLDNKSDLE